MKRNIGIKKFLFRMIIASFILLLLAPAGLAQVEQETEVTIPSEEEMMQRARETVEAYETGNWDLLRKNVAEDAVFYNLGSYDSLSLGQVIEYWKKGRETATPVLSEDGVWLPVEVSAGPREGKWVLHWGNNTLRYPNGETISFPYHVAIKFRDEKVVQAHFYYDNNKIIREMGYQIDLPFEEDEENNGNY